MAERYQLQIKEQATPAAFGHMPNMSVPQTNAFSMMGEQLGKFAEFQKRRQDEWDAASVMNAQVEFDKQLNDYLSNPETGLLNVRKLNGARGLSDETFNYADTIAERIAEQLGNDNQKIAFKKIAEKAKLPYWKHASEYEARQIEEYKKQSFQSSLESANNLLMLNPNDDFVVGTAREQVANAIRAQYYGSPDDYIENMISDAYSQMDAQRIAMIAETDPKKAYELLKSEGVKIKPDVAAKLEGNLKKIVERDAVYSIADNYWNKYGGASEEAYNAIYSDPNLTNEQKDMVYSRIVTRSNMDKRWKQDQEEKWRKDWFAKIDKAKDMEEAERIIGKSGASGPDRIRFLNYASSLFEGPVQEKPEDVYKTFQELKDGKYKNAEEFMAAKKGILNPSTIKHFVTTYFMSPKSNNPGGQPGFSREHAVRSVMRERLHIPETERGSMRAARFVDIFGGEVEVRERELGRALSKEEYVQLLEDTATTFLQMERENGVRYSTPEIIKARRDGWVWDNGRLVKPYTLDNGEVELRIYVPESERGANNGANNGAGAMSVDEYNRRQQEAAVRNRQGGEVNGSVNTPMTPEELRNADQRPSYQRQQGQRQQVSPSLDIIGGSETAPQTAPQTPQSADVRPVSSDVTPVSPDVRPASPDNRFTSPDLASPDVRPVSPDLVSPDVRPTSNDVRNNVAQVINEERDYRASNSSLFGATPAAAAEISQPYEYVLSNRLSTENPSDVDGKPVPKMPMFGYLNDFDSFLNKLRSDSERSIDEKSPKMRGVDRSRIKKNKKPEENPEYLRQLREAKAEVELEREKEIKKARKEVGSSSSNEILSYMESQLNYSGRGKVPKLPLYSSGDVLWAYKHGFEFDPATHLFIREIGEKEIQIYTRDDRISGDNRSYKNITKVNKDDYESEFKGIASKGHSISARNPVLWVNTYNKQSVLLRDYCDMLRKAYESKVDVNKLDEVDNYLRGKGYILYDEYLQERGNSLYYGGHDEFGPDESNETRRVPFDNNVSEADVTPTSSGFVRTADGQSSSLKDMEPAVYRYTEAERTLLDYVRKNNPELLPKIQEVMTFSKIKPIPAHVPGTERMELLSDNSSNESSKVLEVDERVMPDGTPIYADNPYASKPENVKGPLSWITSMFSATPAAAEEMPVNQRQYVAPDNGVGRRYMPPVGQGRPNRDVDRRVMPDGTPIYANNPYTKQVNQKGNSKRVEGSDFDVMNGSLINHSRKYLGRRYVLGGKDPAKDKGWDCSGLVNHAIRGMMKDINKSLGYNAFDNNAFKALSGASADIIEHVSKATGFEKLNPSVNDLKPGMIIGLDAGSGAGGDGYKGIDHVAVVMRDKKGRLRIYEANSKQGTVTTNAATWLNRYRNRGIKAYLVDPTLMMRGKMEPKIDKFENAMEIVFQNEGGYANVEGDKGGATNLGITIGTLKAAHKKGLVSHSDPKKLTRAEAVKIYREMFWKLSKADKLPDKLAAVYFDAVVNHGYRVPAKILQQTLNQVAGANLVVDGKIGPKTLEALNKYLVDDEMRDRYISNLCKVFLDLRQEVYNDIVARNPSQKKFIKGWTNRVNRLRKIV